MTQEAVKPKKKKVWIHVLWISLTVLTLLIAGVCTAAFMLFDENPMPLDKEGTSPLLAFTVMQKGQQNLLAMRQATPISVSKVDYTEDEFNFMARSMLLVNRFQNGGQQLPNVSPENTSLIVKDGIFKLKHVMKTDGNPFGNYLNLSLELKVEIKNGVDTITVLAAKAGSFNIPISRVEQEINTLLQQHYRGTAQEDLVKNSILLFQADGKNVRLEYKPYTLLQDIDQIYFGGSGKFLRKMGHGSK